MDLKSRVHFQGPAVQRPITNGLGISQKIVAIIKLKGGFRGDVSRRLNPPEKRS